MRRLPISNVERFLKLKFDLDQICRRVPIQNHKVWSFRATELHYDFIKYWIKASSYQQNIICSENLRQNVWNKVKKSSKIGQE